MNPTTLNVISLETDLRTSSASFRTSTRGRVQDGNLVERNAHVVAAPVTPERLLRPALDPRAQLAMPRRDALVFHVHVTLHVAKVELGNTKVAPGALYLGRRGRGQPDVVAFSERQAVVTSATCDDRQHEN